MARTVRYYWMAVFLSVVFLTAKGWAGPETDSPDGSVPAPPPLSETQKPGWRARMSDPAQWEIWHDRASTGIVAATERIDRFFGDERLEDDNESTRLKFGIGPRYHKEDGASLVTDIKARLALPRLKNRFQLIIDDFFESDEPEDASVFSEALKDSEPDTALRYVISRNESRRLSADAGVRFSSPSQVFGRLRGRIIVPYPLWELRLTQTAAWFTDDGLVTTSQMGWTRHLGDSWLLRAGSRLTWEENRDGVTPGQSFTLFKELSERQAYAVSLSASWPEMPRTHEAEYPR